jgi:phospholipase D
VIGAAKTSVYQQAYDFTSVTIANALIAAHKRGVDVFVMEDYKASKGKKAILALVKGAGVPCCTVKKFAISHNKIILVDGNIVLTGSYNYSENAEHKNAENMLEITDPALAAIYKANFDKLKGYCQ